MKIVTFQYNKEVAAVLSNNVLARTTLAGKNSETTNIFLANGYADRLLWEESANLRPAKPRDYCIAGNWQ
ncbi:MAG: hypothetical protein FWF31_01785 [Desulfobulbus sp.]|nr:hypothetical protein [Desulfobulbus sp.]